MPAKRSFLDNFPLAEDALIAYEREECEQSGVLAQEFVQIQNEIAFKQLDGVFGINISNELQPSN